ncbi:MAG: hypothetical protein RR190_01580 [Bacteroidales bacterium]
MKKIILSSIFGIFFLGYTTLFAQSSGSIEIKNSQENIYHLKIGIHPAVAFAGFANKDFRTQIQNSTGVKITDAQFGGNFQIGMYSDKRWGIGLEYNIFGSMSPFASSKPTYKFYNMYEGLYGEYEFVKTSRFVFSGQLALGITQASFRYQSGLSEDKIPLGDFLNLPMSKGFEVKQKIQGYVSLGLRAEWILAKGFRLGLFAKWVQQTGKANWYTMDGATVVDGLPKSSMTPLQVGISLIFTL